MEQQIHITLRLHLAIGIVYLNEIVYRLQQLQDQMHDFTVILRCELLALVLGQARSKSGAD